MWKKIKHASEYVVHILTIQFRSGGWVEAGKLKKKSIYVVTFFFF